MSPARREPSSLLIYPTSGLSPTQEKVRLCVKAPEVVAVL